MRQRRPRAAALAVCTNSCTRSNAMASWNTGDIGVNGVRLRYIRTGGNKPPVVLAHGFSDAGLCWTPVAQALEADYDLVMVDARGHGFSDAPETGYTLPEMASDL